MENSSRALIIRYNNKLNGSILYKCSDGIIPKEIEEAKLLFIMTYPNILKERYNIENIDDVLEMFNIIANNIGAIKNNEVDYIRVSEKVYNDLNNGLIKGITLDRWK